MGQRQKEWARRTLESLRLELGGACEACGTTEDLQFDCIEPCGHEHHEMEWSQRASFYRKQHKARNLQLLCAKHNNLKSVIDKQKIRAARVAAHNSEVLKSASDSRSDTASELGVFAM